LYCPSCDQSFGETLSRCPQCHCWLKPSGRPSVKAEVDTGRSGWLSAGTSDSPREDGWKLPEDVPEECGWSSPASPTKEPSQGWIDEGLNDSEEEFGWHYNEPATTTLEGVNRHDEWVDEEFGQDYEEDDSSYQPSTQRIDLTEEAHGNPLKALLVASLALVLVSLLYMQFGRRSNPVPTEDSVKAEALQSAEIWNQSARESVDQGQFEQASLQYRRVVKYLLEGEADRERIVRARVEYSDALIDSGDYLSAHEQIFQVSSDISDGKERLAWIERELVQEAILQLGQARKLLSSQPKDSVKLAENALEVFLIFNASNSRMAQAHDVMARGYLNQGQVTAAAESVKDAMRWESSPDRLALFGELFPSAPPPKVKPERRAPLRVQASLGEADETPQGQKQRRQSYRNNRNSVVIVPETQQKQKRSEHKPNYEKFRKSNQKRLGHNPLTDN
jgi:hypothetical protein